MGIYCKRNIADNKPEGEEYRGIKILGGTDKLAEILPQNQLDEIVIHLDWLSIINLDEL